MTLDSVEIVTRILAELAIVAGLVWGFRRVAP